MSLANLSQLKKNTKVKLRGGGFAFFRGVNEDGRNSTVSICETSTGRKTQDVTLQSIDSAA